MMNNLIKETNLHKLRNALRREKVATKSRLSELTGISVVTVQSLLLSLLETGEVCEDEMIQPRLGRPAISYRFNECFQLMLVITVLEKNRKDTAVYSIVNLYGEVIYEREEVYAHVNKGCFIEDVSKILQAYPQGNIVLIALGLAGVAHHGKILFSDYEKLKDVDMKQELTELYHIPVLIENDVNGAVYGYLKSREDKPDSVVGIYMPSKYPPGAGICLHQHIIRGKNGLAGEIAQLPLGITWETFDYNREDVDRFIVNAVKSLACMYNPEVMVIYDERACRDTLRTEIEQAMDSQMGKWICPEIVIKENMKEDFRNGMIYLALSEVLQED